MRTIVATGLWSVLSRLAARRRRDPTAGEVAAHVHSGQTAGTGVRTSELLRNRMRPRWLRLRRAAQPDEQPTPDYK